MTVAAAPYGQISGHVRARLWLQIGVWVGVVAVVLASINAFGGFLVTQRMLQMFKRREPAAKPVVKP